MYDRPAVAALRDHLAAVVAEHPSLTTNDKQEELRHLVCDVVDDLKASRLPPERIIVAVKRIAGDAGIHPPRDILSAVSPLTNYDAALVSMVRWCIDRYYEANAR